MARRKPVDEGCTGGIFCPVEDHVNRRDIGNGGTLRIGHIPLTVGQKKTIQERKRGIQRAGS